MIRVSRFLIISGFVYTCLCVRERFSLRCLELIDAESPPGQKPFVGVLGTLTSGQPSALDVPNQSHSSVSFPLPFLRPNTSETEMGLE